MGFIEDKGSVWENAAVVIERGGDWNVEFTRSKCAVRCTICKYREGPRSKIRSEHGHLMSRGHVAGLSGI